MKLHAAVTINGRAYQQGDEIAWYQVYPFFLFHMLMFGGSGFVMAYTRNGPPLAFLYLHGGIAITVYTSFYIVIFGLDEVKWMFINAGLGVLGIYTQVGWGLSYFGKRIEDYPLPVHVVPFLYYTLYTFLLRHAVLDLTGAREDETRREKAEYSYIAFYVAISLLTYYLEKR